MDDDKRMLRRAENLPAGILTEWEQGFLFGALYGKSAHGVLQALSRKIAENDPIE